MRSKKIKIETILEDGSKVSIIISGKPDISKIEKLFMMMDILESNTNIDPRVINTNSIYEKVKFLVDNQFGNKTFSLSEFYRVYQQYYSDNIKKSTLSTYLTRLVDEGYLIREGYRGKYRYRFIGVTHIGRISEKY